MFCLRDDQSKLIKGIPSGIDLSPFDSNSVYVAKIFEISNKFKEITDAIQGFDGCDVLRNEAGDFLAVFGDKKTGFTVSVLMKNTKLFVHHPMDKLCSQFIQTHFIVKIKKNH